LQNWGIVPLGKGFFELKFNSIEDMRRILALGAVHLKPGLMRFYCCTKDFTPQAQAHTHAQVWVRLMSLPQEYWEKQTLFEIASGLGTPLTIDEAAQHRRFGIYARILIDVDLSEKMFETVVVERDDHALSIVVHYEKHPMFCANCRMLGHDIQHCTKLNLPHTVAGPVKMHKKPHNVMDIVIEKSGETGKGYVQALGNSLFKQLPEAYAQDRNNKTEKKLAEQLSQDTQFASVAEIEEGEIFPNTHTTNGMKDMISHDVTGVSSNPRLITNNPFELLASDEDTCAGEANADDGILPSMSVEDTLNISEKVVEVSLGKEQLVHPTIAEDPGNLKRRTSQSVASVPKFPVVGSGNGSFPNAPSVSPGLAMDPGVYEPSRLQPIITPITTYNEVLGPDKRKVQSVNGDMKATVASIKSIKILSKFWGDCQDSDNTADPETDIESHQTISADASEYLATPFDNGKKGKRGRPRKNPNKKVDAHIHNNEIESVTTRSKTGSQSHANNIVSQ